MSDINNVSLTGRLTRDPELRVTAGGHTAPLIHLGLQHLGAQQADGRVG